MQKIKIHKEKVGKNKQIDRRRERGGDGGSRSSHVSKRVGKKKYKGKKGGILLTQPGKKCERIRK